MATPSPSRLALFPLASTYLMPWPCATINTSIAFMNSYRDIIALDYNTYKTTCDTLFKEARTHVISRLPSSQEARKEACEEARRKPAHRPNVIKPVNNTYKTVSGTFFKDERIHTISCLSSSQGRTQDERMGRTQDERT